MKSKGFFIMGKWYCKPTEYRGYSDKKTEGVTCKIPKQLKPKVPLEVVITFEEIREKIGHWPDENEVKSFVAASIK